MLKSLLMLAQMGEIEADEAKQQIGSTTSGGSPFLSTDTMMVLGAIMVVAGALFSWAFFIRKRSTDRHGALVSSGNSSRGRASASSSGKDGKVRRRRRREHPDNLPRNPTLGETGGLPPMRPDEEGSPPQPR